MHGDCSRQPCPCVFWILESEQDRSMRRCCVRFPPEILQPPQASKSILIMASLPAHSGKSYPLDIRLDDFTRALPPLPSERYNLIVCNPPYVRHHHHGGCRESSTAECNCRRLWRAHWRIGRSLLSLYGAGARLACGGWHRRLAGSQRVYGRELRGRAQEISAHIRSNCCAFIVLIRTTFSLRMHWSLLRSSGFASAAQCRAHVLNLPMGERMSARPIPVVVPAAALAFGSQMDTFPCWGCPCDKQWFAP